MREPLVVCPYKTIMGRGCEHRYAHKAKVGTKIKGICNCPNPEDCQLFKLWEEEVNQMEEKQNGKSRR